MSEAASGDFLAGRERVMECYHTVTTLAMDEDERYWPEMVPGWVGEEETYKGDSHREANVVGIPTCLDRSTEIPSEHKLDCSACAVEQGYAVMIRWDRSSLWQGRPLWDWIRGQRKQVAHAIAQHARTTPREPTPLEVAEARIAELEAQVRDLEIQRDLAKQPAWTKDWEALGENVRGHCLLPMPEPHEDGRACSWHARLDAWAFDHDKKCLREHPDVLDLMHRHDERWADLD